MLSLDTRTAGMWTGNYALNAKLVNLLMFSNNLTTQLNLAYLKPTYLNLAMAYLTKLDLTLSVLTLQG